MECNYQLAAPTMTTEEIIAALRKIQKGIDADRFTMENIDDLIKKLRS